jgi:hypothetical protein
VNVALERHLVRGRHQLVEDLGTQRTRSGCATHEPSNPCRASRVLSSRTFANAASLTAASRQDGMNAARSDARAHAAGAPNWETCPRCRGLRLGLWSVVAVLLAQLVLSGCGDHSSPAADKCSRHARAATTGQRMNWDGVQFDVPVDWYAVSTCFTPSTDPPVGLLTTQPPHAQCRELADGRGGHCGAPVHLDGSDVWSRRLRATNT